MEAIKFPTPTVFVVDDNKSLQHAFHRLIKTIHMDYKGYASAEEFLADFKPTLMGCLVVVIQMPDMSGMNLLKRLPQLQSELPVIIISGDRDVNTAVQAMKLVAVDFIERPFRDQMLIDSINEAVQKHMRIRPKQQQSKKMLALGPKTEFSDRLLGKKERP